ncbi:MAG: hypothetical protein JSR47_12895 [Proteobacteria bacterium]|nr:hypothetical protein [Pseudomonadota bacterium]
MKTLSRRHALLALPLLSALGARASAQTRSSLPDRALRILVGFSAGGGAELLARVVAPRLELRTSRRVTIDNKPNDRAEPAGEFLRKGLTEGSVIAFLPTTTISAMADKETFPFDSRSDLVPLTMAGMFQVVLAVAPETGVASFADYAKWLKEGGRERRRLGLTATDTYLKLYARILGRELGVEFEVTPFKGASPLAAALKAGKIPAGIGSVPPLLEHNRTGAVKFLMTSGAKRVSVLRTVPTVVELGRQALELPEWYGFFAASATPPAIAAEWSRQLQPILREPETVAKLAVFGLDATPTTQAEALRLYTERLQFWKVKLASFDMKEGE